MENKNEQEIEKVDSVFIEKKNFFKKILSGIGIGGAIVGGGLLSLILLVVRFLFIASTGLSAVWYSIILFNSGSIVWGLVVLIIGTPIAIGVASYLFIPLLLFSIVALIIWGITSIFGFDISFSGVWDWLWFGMKILLIGGMAFMGISEFINSFKQKRVKQFFKENWFYIPLFLFLFWLFFLNFNKNIDEISHPNLNQTNQENIELTESYMVGVASKINENLPIVIDESSILDSVIGTKNRLTYKYILIGIYVNQLDWGVLKNEIKEELKNSVCIESTYRVFVENGAELAFSYYDYDGGFIGETVIDTKLDCD